MSADYRAVVNGAEWKGFSHGHKGVNVSGPEGDFWLNAPAIVGVLRILAQYRGPQFVLDVVEMCTCVADKGCSELDSECPVCSRRDAYDPCALMGFGCGSLAKDTDTPCECCTPMQWALAKEFWK